MVTVTEAKEGVEGVVSDEQQCKCIYGVLSSILVLNNGHTSLTNMNTKDFCATKPIVSTIHKQRQNSFYGNFSCYVDWNDGGANWNDPPGFVITRTNIETGKHHHEEYEWRFPITLETFSDETVHVIDDNHVLLCSEDEDEDGNIIDICYLVHLGSWEYRRLDDIFIHINCGFLIVALHSEDCQNLYICSEFNPHNDNPFELLLLEGVHSDVEMVPLHNVNAMCFFELNECDLVNLWVCNGNTMHNCMIDYPLLCDFKLHQQPSAIYLWEMTSERLSMSFSTGSYVKTITINNDHNSYNINYGYFDYQMMDVFPVEQLELPFLYNNGDLSEFVYLCRPSEVLFGVWNQSATKILPNSVLAHKSDMHEKQEIFFDFIQNRIVVLHGQNLIIGPTAIIHNRAVIPPSDSSDLTVFVDVITENRTSSYSIQWVDGTIASCVDITIASTAKLKGSIFEKPFFVDETNNMFFVGDRTQFMMINGPVTHFCGMAHTLAVLTNVELKLVFFSNDSQMINALTISIENGIKCYVSPYRDGNLQLVCVAHYEKLPNSEECWQKYELFCIDTEMASIVDRFVLNEPNDYSKCMSYYLNAWTVGVHEGSLEFELLNGNLQIKKTNMHQRVSYCSYDLPPNIRWTSLPFSNDDSSCFEIKKIWFDGDKFVTVEHNVYNVEEFIQHAEIVHLYLPTFE
ncbi:hypothetical protein PCE1_003119 [Barthelona sp. PCE]